MPELAYVNGTFGPIETATISIEDRGFQFGHGVYEVVVTYDGRVFMPDEHIDRLRTSARAVVPHSARGGHHEGSCPRSPP